MSDDSKMLDNRMMAYRINNRILQEIMTDPWTHPDAVPEEIMIDMSHLWMEMIDLIPESHSLQILAMVYG